MRWFPLILSIMFMNACLAWAAATSNGSTSWSGKNILYSAQGVHDAAVSASSVTNACTVKATVDGKDFQVRITSSGVEAGKEHVLLKAFSSVEVRVDGKALRVWVDGKLVIPRPLK